MGYGPAANPHPTTTTMVRMNPLELLRCFVALHSVRPFNFFVWGGFLLPPSSMKFDSGRVCLGFRLCFAAGPVCWHLRVLIQRKHQHAT